MFQFLSYHRMMIGFMLSILKSIQLLKLKVILFMRALFLNLKRVMPGLHQDHI